jgi:hypothetical protein
MNPITFTLAILVVLLDVMATVMLLRSALFSIAQRILYIALIWMVPLAGSLIAISALRSAQAKADRLDQLRILGEIWRAANQDDHPLG